MIGDRVSDRNNNTSYTEKYQKHKHIPCSFAYKVVCIDYKSSKPLQEKNGINKFIETILTEYDYFKSEINNHFN